VEWTWRARGVKLVRKFVTRQRSCSKSTGRISSSEVSSCASLNEQNYSELLEAFQETHNEANRLVLSNN